MSTEPPVNELILLFFAEAKAGIAECREKKAGTEGEGDLDVTTEGLISDITTLNGLRKACLKKIQDYEAAVKSCEEELKSQMEILMG